MPKKKADKSKRTLSQGKQPKSDSSRKSADSAKDYDFGGVRELSSSEIMGLVSTLFASGAAHAGGACKY